MKLFLQLILTITFYSSTLVSAKTLVISEEASTVVIYPTRSAPAIVIALNQSVIPAQTSGVVTKLLVNVGDNVLKGEILATLDCQINVLNHRSQAATFEQLYSQLLFNKRELVRGRSLLEQKNIGEAELDRLNNAVENSRAILQMQKALVERASVNIERCNIKAPFNGIITKRLVSLGEMIDFGKPLVEIIENTRLEVSAKIAGGDEVSFNKAKTFTLDIAERLYNVTRRAFLPVIENNSRSREARFIFIDQQAIAGDTGRLRWKSASPYLPAHLLQKRQGKNGYFINENNIAKFIEVDTAQEGRPLVYVLGESTQIITQGHHGLKDGDPIKLKKSIVPPRVNNNLRREKS